MKTICNDTNNKIEIKKSKFYCYLFKVDNLDEINQKINDLKKIYKDATHYCFAYILDNVKRYNDDSEPSKTAGMPILNVLEKNELNHILCVVVRYFGGIKLGAGGLVRAYTKSVVDTLAITKAKILEESFKIKIEFSYDNSKTINRIIDENFIISKTFKTNLKYIIIIPTKKFEIIKDELNNKTIKLEILEKIMY